MIIWFVRYGWLTGGLGQLRRYAKSFGYELGRAVSIGLDAVLFGISERKRSLSGDE
ncbi:hypothetical protein DSUL_50066 [Desulfovibrionales bacterium]